MSLTSKFSKFSDVRQNMSLEVKLLLQNSGITFHKEHQFCERKWRFDFAIPSKMIAIECEGMSGADKKGVGRHRTVTGFVKDAEKYNRAQKDGWRVIRVIPDWAWRATGLKGRNPCSSVAAVDEVKNSPNVA